MAQKNRVLQSINLDGECQCVDIFQRPDGSFGFEEFRRDIEDNRGWFPIGYFSGQTFASEIEAFDAALDKVAWFREKMSKETRNKA